VLPSTRFIESVHGASLLEELRHQEPADHQDADGEFAGHAGYGAEEGAPGGAAGGEDALAAEELAKEDAGEGTGDKADGSVEDADDGAEDAADGAPPGGAEVLCAHRAAHEIENETDEHEECEDEDGGQTGAIAGEDEVIEDCGGDDEGGIGQEREEGAAEAGEHDEDDENQPEGVHDWMPDRDLNCGDI